MKALRKSLFSALGLAVLVGALVPSLSDARGFGFAKRVAGSYSGTVEVKSVDGVPVPPNGPRVFPALFTIHADRTSLFTSPNLFQSLGHGAWSKGNILRQIGGFLESLEYAAPEGFVIRRLVTRFVMNFDEGFERFTGAAIVSIFDCTVVDIALVCGAPPDDPISENFVDITGQRIAGGDDDMDRDDDGDDDDDDDGDDDDD